jgi:hypothetical protein
MEAPKSPSKPTEPPKMSNLNSFTCFPRLPKELRDIIWSHSLLPQLISLSCTVYTFTPQNAPLFMYLLGGDEPFTHFTMDTPERPTSPYYTAHLEPVGIVTLTAFSVCRESRSLAYSKGYQARRMAHRDGKVRDLIWNPFKDTVLLLAEADPLRYLDLFFEQFPTQAKEIQKLALPRSFGRSSTETDIQFMNLPALGELLIMFDKEYFDDWIEAKDDGPMNRLRFPCCVGRSLWSTIEKHRKWQGSCAVKVPRVSVALNYDMIAAGEGIDLDNDVWRE